MHTYLSKELWTRYIKGWSCIDCAVRDRNIIYLGLRKDLPESETSRMWDHDILTRQMAIYLDTPDEPFGLKGLSGYNKPRLGISLATLSASA